MFKHLQTKFLALLAIMLMGGSNAWAEEVVYKTALFGSSHNDGNSSYTSSFEATNDGFVVTATNFNNNNNGWTNSSGNGQIKCGRKNNASTGTITTKAAIDEAITKVVVTIDALTESKINSVKLYTSSNNTSWTEAGTFTKARGEQTVTLSTPTANLYYKLEFDCASGSSNGLITVSKVEFYHNSSTPSTEPSVTVSTNSIEATADETDGTINVTYTNFSEVVAGVAFYDAEGTTTTYDWVTAEIDENNNLYYLIEANEGEARTAYMKVYALDDEANEVYSELITITQAAYEAPFEATNYTLASSITSGKHYIIVGSSTMADYAMGVQNNNNRAAVEIEISGETATVASEDVHEVQICGPDADGFYTINDGGYLYAASSSNNYLRTEETLDNNGRWSITFGDEGEANIVAKGSNTRNTMQFNASNHIFACYASASQVDVYLYEKADEATPKETVSISSAGMATFCSENALDFTGLTDMYAYIAQYNNDKVTYRKVTKVPARTGVLLRNPNGGDTNHEVPVLTGAADDVDGNKFIGTLTDINELASVVETNTNYILNNGDNGVGFYKANGQKVGAGKAYLQLPTEGAKTFIGFEEEGEATSISTIDNGQLTMDNAYNLQGQKVGSEYKGIVIVNGKKIMVK